MESISREKHKQKTSQSRIAAAANINIMTLRKRLSKIRTVLMNTQFLN
jgi:transcription initiation factor TFIIB